MHDTHDVRKSKELHDKEILIDEKAYKIPTPSEMAEDQVFRVELCRILTRIAKALEYIENGIVHIKGEY